ncbi:neprilysin-2-like [Photinus pyralis]|uniref:Peptidase M13 N-terminal domain-containing protein n=3 Tax=Photinus pyralis TaxID=7054 RepID=A0A1Y1L881_PHOPY|nr:neprilysin-2-like [Photinus pyralis]
MNNSYNIENEKGDMKGSWWKRRSKMEKKLTILSILALAVIVILVIVIIIFFTRAPDVCLSASCVHVTNHLLDHMDPDVDPCEDFYEFACGGFMDNVQLDDDYVKTINTFMEDTVQDRIRGIIEEPEEDDDPRSIANAKRLYRACMNLTAIEEKGLRLIKDSIRQIGGWPLLENSNWKEKDFDWKTATYKLRELGYGFQFFIVMRIKPDENDPSKRIIMLHSPWSSLSRTDSNEEERLFELYVDIAEVFEVDKNRARNEYREVIDFMKTLFITPEETKDLDDKYDPLTISELQYKFRDVPWLEYINRLQFPAPNISYEQIVTVSDSPYFIRLQNALRRTPKRVLANFIAMEAILQHSMYLTRDIRDVVMKYYEAMRLEKNHVMNVPPRHELCSQLVGYTFSLPLQAAYVEKHFSNHAKDRAYEIFQDVKNEFKEVVSNLKWMDEETRVKALERLFSSKSYIGYPADLLHFDKIEQRYQGYHMEEDNFLASVLNADYYATNNRFKLLHEPVTKDEELNDAYATYTQSSYYDNDNTITIPAGMLQGVIFDEDRPNYLNFGALGSAMGHELFHTVFEGPSCGKPKISKHYDFISTQTMLRYKEKLSCVAMHYGKYFVPEVREYLNSSNTQNEDIADIAGVKLAYEAYNDWLSKNGAEKRLPGVDYTPKQLFWIASAMRWCAKGTVESIENSIAHSSSSLKRFRVLGTLRNMEEFARDFQCSSTSYMNNENKCELW